VGNRVIERHSAPLERVFPLKVAAAAAAPRVGNGEAVDVEEFRAFQEWRSAA
jgi:hypothetical protein